MAFGYLREDEYDANGQKLEEFVSEFKLWFGYRQQTLNQQYTLEGLDIKKTKLIAVRHSHKIKESMYCQIDDDLFKIVTLSADERNGTGLNSYDILTLQLIEKRGA
ncbi:hypothetical protein IV67_GL001549 [Weissella minor]|uniref:Phage head-tail adaptor n=1 Tax=Weissella minor TaxID=1620 RepID=A0A0R2JNN5_9LACO|nr:hypothetical protein IV67_GL001549 [Weissella minor]